MAGGGVGTSERVMQVTIEEWSKEVSEETEKNLIQLAMMKSEGAISYGHSGGQFRWPVRKADHDLRGFPDMQPVTFARKNTKTNAVLPWRGYYASDTITLREKLEQGGPEAMVKIFESREELIRDGIMRGLADEMYVDGNTAANAALEKFHGIESFMGIAAQTASDILATTHNDSYAGLSTAAQAVGGASQPKVWTPVIVNTGYTPSGGTQRTWANYADEYMRRAWLEATYGKGNKNKVNLALLNKTGWEEFLNLIDDKEELTVGRGTDLKLVSLGFEDHVKFDGVPIMWDEAVPTTDSDSTVVQGYGYTTGRMKMKVMGPKGQKSLFTSKVTFNDTYRADNIFLHLVGNLEFDGPRHFVKFADISAVAS
jgi:hypothetical protein